MVTSLCDIAGKRDAIDVPFGELRRNRLIPRQLAPWWSLTGLGGQEAIVPERLFDRFLVWPSLLDSAVFGDVDRLFGRHDVQAFESCLDLGDLSAEQQD
jgi:hypothetical protein